jgi:hypothetical protein
MLDFFDRVDCSNCLGEGEGDEGEKAEEGGEETKEEESDEGLYHSSPTYM